MLGVVGKKCKKMQKFYIILKGKGGLKLCEGEKGQGERGNPRGERGVEVDELGKVK